jgi:hypothetical protein
MSYGADKWKAGDSFSGSLRSAQAMRFYGLSKMLEAAELAARGGSKAEAVEHLRELQAHLRENGCYLGARPKLVAA